MNIVGLSAYRHDAAACLVQDGRIVAAAQEERFTRRKHDAVFPAQALRFCLDQAALSARDIDHVVFYEQAAPPQASVLQCALLDALVRYIDREVDWSARLLFSRHHLSHAASAFFPSPFQDAAVLTLDDVGESVTTSLAIGCGRELDVVWETPFPHSLGLLYAAFTRHTGFKVNGGEYKVMGLAPFGEPRFAHLIRDHLIDIRDDGSFRLNMDCFRADAAGLLTTPRFDELMGGPARAAEAPITQRDMDLAASIQSVTEEVVIRLARGVRRSTGQRNLCLAGGVALNCVANGKLLRERVFDRIWVQPAAGDAGGAIGAALSVHHRLSGRPRLAGPGDAMAGSYLGPAYSQQDIEGRLRRMGAVFSTLDDEALIDATAQALIRGCAVGWHQGRMEFGPRALGARSILADPRSPWVQGQLNLQVKFREPFRPFAPSVLREDVHDWFDMDEDSPYMLMAAGVAPHRQRLLSPEQRRLTGMERLNVPRSTIPAVTHVDGTARVQTVHAETNPRYHRLIRRFKALTGCPVLVNTSFNVRGEPVVCSPEDAFHGLMGTDIGFLAVGNCVLRKEEQSAALRRDHRSAFAPD